MMITPKQIRDGIIERIKDESAENLHFDNIADPAIFDKSRGDSVADQMRPDGVNPGLSFRKGDNTRLAGLMQVHERLRFAPDGRPKMYIFSNCVDWIRTVPNLPYSMTKPEDIDTDAEDHAYDDTRYFLMAHPIAAKTTRTRRVREYDPFRMEDENEEEPGYSYSGGYN